MNRSVIVIIGACLGLFLFHTACSPVLPPEKEVSPSKKIVQAKPSAPLVYPYTDFLNETNQIRLLVWGNDLHNASTRLNALRAKTDNLPPTKGEHELVELQLEKNGVLSNLYIPMSTKKDRFSQVEKAIADARIKGLSISGLKIGMAETKMDANSAREQINEAMQSLKDSKKLDEIHRAAAVDRSLRNASGVIGNVKEMKLGEKQAVRDYLALTKIMRENREYAQARAMLGKSRDAMEAYRVKYSLHAPKDGELEEMRQEVEQQEAAVEEADPSLVNQLGQSVDRFLERFIK